MTFESQNEHGVFTPDQIIEALLNQSEPEYLLKQLRKLTDHYLLEAVDDPRKERLRAYTTYEILSAMLHQVAIMQKGRREAV